MTGILLLLICRKSRFPFSVSGFLRPEMFVGTPISLRKPSPSPLPNLDPFADSSAGITIPQPEQNPTGLVSGE